MSANASADDAEALKSLFVELTGDQVVTERRQGTNERESTGETDSLAGMSEQEGLSGAIERPDEAF